MTRHRADIASSALKQHNQLLRQQPTPSGIDLVSLRSQSIFSVAMTSTNPFSLNMGSPFDNNHRMDMRAPFISSRTRAAKTCQNIRRESVERRKTQESIDEHRDRLLLYSSTVEPLGNAGDELITYTWNLDFSIHLFDEDASDYVAVSLARERVCSLIHLFGPITDQSRLHRSGISFGL